MPRRARSRSSTSSPIWSYAHPRAIELSARIASLAPGDLNRVFFTSGGSEAVESAIKLARAYHQRTGNPRKIKFISREIAYHGTTLGALAATGISDLRQRVRAPGTGRIPGAQHGQLPVARRSAIPSGRPTRSRRGSSSSTPTRSRRSSSSRSRTPAAASRRRTATSSAYARSATATTYC